MPAQIDIDRVEMEEKVPIEPIERESKLIQAFSVWKRKDGRQYIVLDFEPSSMRIENIILKDLKTMLVYRLSASMFRQRIEGGIIERNYGTSDE